MVLIGLSLLAYLWWLSLPSIPCLCHGGCQCGKAKGSKTETRATDLERQARERAASQAEQQRSQAFQVAEQQRQQAESGRARLISEFSRTPEEAQILQELRKRAGFTGEQLVRETGPITSRLIDLIQQRLGSPPQVPFESTLRPALELARQNVESQFARRGITPTSGLALEGLGRAGVDLAIKEAQAREQNRLANEQLIQETLNRAGSLGQFASGIQSEAIGAETDFEKALRDQELRGVDLGEHSLQAGLGRGFSAQERGLVQAAQREALGEQASNQFATQGLQALQQREEAARQRDAAIAQALGSVALGAVTGGVGAAFPAIGGALGVSGMGTGLGGVLQGAALGGLRSAAGNPLGSQSLLENLLNSQRGLGGFGGDRSIYESPSGNLTFLSPTTDEEKLLRAQGVGGRIFRRGLF